MWFDNVCHGLQHNSIFYINLELSICWYPLRTPKNRRTQPQQGIYRALAVIKITWYKSNPPKNHYLYAIHCCFKLVVCEMTAIIRHLRRYLMSPLCSRSWKFHDIACLQFLKIIWTNMLLFFALSHLNHRLEKNSGFREHQVSLYTGQLQEQGALYSWLVLTLGDTQCKSEKHPCSLFVTTGTRGPILIIIPLLCSEMKMQKKSSLDLPPHLKICCSTTLQNLNVQLQLFINTNQNNACTRW